MAPDYRDSSLRVSIQWQEQTVFAGEDVKCIITFRNASFDPSLPSSSHGLSSPGSFSTTAATATAASAIPTTFAGLTGSVSPPPSSSSHQRGASRSSTLSLLDRARNVQSPPSRGKLAGGSISQPSTPSSRAHRSGLSLSVPASGQRSRSGSVQWSAPAPTLPPPVVSHDGRPNHSHRRSVSIVSIGSAASTADDQILEHGMVSPSSRMSSRLPRGHSRASSLQISPLSPHGANSATNSPRVATPPAYNRNGHRSPQNFNIHSPQASGQSPRALPDFRFPAAAMSPLHNVQNSSSPPPPDDVVSPRTEHMVAAPSTLASTSAPPKSRDSSTSQLASSDSAHQAQIGYISATSLADATPRSSTELYALSNNSSETLASEYPGNTFGRGNGSASARPAYRRQTSPRQTEVLMMGFAQIQGSFTLDGSLVNLTPFEAVKRKGVVGGQGGGVVGVENTKRDSGFFGGWGSFKNSISELMGNRELSTIQEMRGAAKSRSIPLLSTPQSVLFVDLRLAPGESKSFEYVFSLPRGLPPTHRGRAMKISYSLVVGTQRAGGRKEQQVRTIDLPFRVLGSVNGRGEILGHDLMKPYILLQDTAKTRPLSKSSARSKPAVKGEAQDPYDSKEGFLSYVNEILRRSAQSPTSGLLSPTAMPTSRRPSLFEEPITAKESIDLAILRSNMALNGKQSPNKFEIARNGQRVAVVMLSRPAYRLGETVTIAVDFGRAEIPCYAIHAALETTEKIDASLAVRSEASVHRVTKKTMCLASEATLYSRRFVFMPTIPITATPEFITSGISFEWKVRLEFVVPSSTAVKGVGSANGHSASTMTTHASGNGPDAAGRMPHPLLEQISRDEKGGLVMVAVENLICESFEVAVPLRVYGTVGTGLEKLDKDEALDEGYLM
ncbi:hypothetical protein TD95_000013 [Thielaviopsis punctulata]|uniref:Rgp1-domain-containing protein n=1 Tax=Thielaviopsis punctulata TaxID=72032 RepID=A0A0F4Z8U2_9PEZI|nr:hypothetical protein TD95_000013 [Thielaviopsis punctulata]